MIREKIKIGDTVTHSEHPEWGAATVVDSFGGFVEIIYWAVPDVTLLCSKTFTRKV